MAIVDTVNRLRLVTGQQLERLHFEELIGRSRAVVRWRVLRRLVEWRLLVPLERRIGGARSGSGGLVYALDTAGQKLVQLRRNLQPGAAPARRPGAPGERFVQHTLAVSELYTQLRERERGGSFRLSTFDAEPNSWWPDGRGSLLKPDAFVVLSAGEYDYATWVEVDRSTESLPTLRRKLAAYVDFVRRGQLGPGDVVPRVLVTVLNRARGEAVEGLVEGLLEPGRELVGVVMQDQAVEEMVRGLDG
ncbi:replication-relaxation family protein [Streptomyces olivoreticuli]